MVKYEEPIITAVDSPVSESVETHPAYAQIGASRVSGSKFLYGSDFSHQHYICITISASELHRGLSRDWPSARRELIEVQLSEAQWATFVSTLNMGEGTQCTIRHIGQRDVAQIPMVKSRQEQFQAEANGRMDIALIELATLRSEIGDIKISEKAKTALLRRVDHVQMELTDNLGFVANQFGEHMEEITEHAKIEVNAYVQNVIARAGMTALTGSPIGLLGSANDAAIDPPAREGE